jgi:hypothetical protein
MITIPAKKHIPLPDWIKWDKDSWKQTPNLDYMRFITKNGKRIRIR